MNDLTSSSVPGGFQAILSRDGHPAITYRTAGMSAVAVFFAIWLSGWTAGCVFFTREALLDRAGIQYGALLFIALFWCAEFGVLGYALWHFRSLSTFTFYPDRLRVERRLFYYRRELSIPKQEIAGVRQVKDGGEGGDSFPSWGLVIKSKAEIKILSRQEREKSEWLGPVIARWAGVPYESSRRVCT